MNIDKTLIEFFQQDGAVLIPGLMQGYVTELREGVAKNMQSPGPYASDNFKQGHTGLFLMTIAIGSISPNLNTSYGSRQRYRWRRS